MSRQWLSGAAGALALLGAVWMAHKAGQWSHVRALHSASVEAAHLAAVTAELHAALLHERATPIAFGPAVPLATQRWVTVQNPDGAGHPRGARPFGEACSLERGELVLMVARGEVGVLMEVLPREQAASVAACPARTLFRMPATEYRAIEAAYLAELQTKTRPRN
jgi:hypothetical protein